jgi:hypothetical protein
MARLGRNATNAAGTMKVKRRRTAVAKMLVGQVDR